MLHPHPDAGPDGTAAPRLPFRAVVVGTDFSPTVHAAERYGALLAERSGIELVILHAFTLVQPALEAEALAHRASAQRDEIRNLLEQSAADARVPATRLLCEAAPIDAIRRVSDQYAPSLVVIGTHGPGTVERRLLGSTAEALLRSTAAPVLTVGPHVAPPASLTCRRVLYATDYSEAAAHAKAVALAWAHTFGADVDVLHVAADDGIPIHHRILDQASNSGADVIVLGAHRHSQLSMHVRTGPAFRVILDARCPVLTVSGSAAQEARES